MNTSRSHELSVSFRAALILKRKELTELSKNSCGCQSILLLIRRDLMRNLSCAYVCIYTSGASKRRLQKMIPVVRHMSMFACISKRVGLMLDFFLMHEKCFLYSIWERETSRQIPKQNVCYWAGVKNMPACLHSLLAFLPSFQCSLPSSPLSLLPFLPSFPPFLPCIQNWLFSPHISPSLPGSNHASLSSNEISKTSNWVSQFSDFKLVFAPNA